MRPKNRSHKMHRPKEGKRTDPRTGPRKDKRADPGKGKRTDPGKGKRTDQRKGKRKGIRKGIRKIIRTDPRTGPRKGKIAGLAMHSLVFRANLLFLVSERAKEHLARGKEQIAHGCSFVTSDRRDSLMVALI